MPQDIYDVFEETLRRLFGPQLKNDDQLCKDIWSALANVDWYWTKAETLPNVCGYSFRAAGALVARLRGEGDYLDWYMSGPDATVSDYIARSMWKEGWMFQDMGLICDEPGCLADVGLIWHTANGPRGTCYEHWEKRYVGQKDLKVKTKD